MVVCCVVVCNVSWGSYRIMLVFLIFLIFVDC